MRTVGAANASSQTQKQAGALKSRILQKIKPSLEDEAQMHEVVVKFERKLKRASKKVDLDCEFFVGGSLILTELSSFFTFTA